MMKSQIHKSLQKIAIAISVPVLLCVFGISILLLIFGIFSSITAEYEDISTDAEYAHLIDRKYVTLQKLLLQGITDDLNNRKHIARYSVAKYPGGGGSEYVMTKQLKPGTVFIVQKISRCSNCPFTKFVRVEIGFESKNPKQAAPISLVGRLLVEGINGRVGLDPDFLKEISNNVAPLPNR